MLTLWK